MKYALPNLFQITILKTSKSTDYVLFINHSLWHVNYILRHINKRIENREQIFNNLQWVDDALFYRTFTFKMACLIWFLFNLITAKKFSNYSFLFCLDFKPASVMDVRYDETKNAAASMGDRSQSVPGLNIVSFLL